MITAAALTSADAVSTTRKNERAPTNEENFQKPARVDAAALDSK
jgi:hypothetical protein